ISTKLLNKKNTFYSINELYKYLNKNTESDYLIIPILISDTLDSSDERINKLCKLLKTFSNDEYTSALGDKFIFFLINIELFKKKGDEPTIVNAIEYLQTNLKAVDLSKLELIDDYTIVNWIMEYFDNNPKVASEQFAMH